MESIPRDAGVYRITCTANGKIYIGSAQDLESRRRKHWKCLRGGYHENKYMQHAWNKHGASTFRFEVMEVCHADERIAREQHYLDTLRPCDRSVGFNVSIKAGAPMAGRKHTPETRAKMSQSNRGRKHTEETRRMMSERNKGKVFRRAGVFAMPPKSPKKPRGGNVPSAAARKRMSINGLARYGKYLLPGFEEVW